MSLVGFVLSGICNYFYPVKEEDNKDKMLSDSFKLSLGPSAEASLPDYVAKNYPDRSYEFSQPPSFSNKDLEMEVGSGRYLVVDHQKDLPYASGYEPGFIVLIRSVNHVGVARIHRSIEPLKEALEEIKTLGDKDIEVFIVDGKASDTKLHEEACRYIKAFDKAHGHTVISDDLFRAFDFCGPNPSQKPGVKFAGFDESHNAVAHIDYR